MRIRYKTSSVVIPGLGGRDPGFEETVDDALGHELVDRGVADKVPELFQFESPQSEPEPLIVPQNDVGTADEGE